MCNSYTPGKIPSMIKAKCPRCRSGKMFHSSFWDLKNFTRMHDDCPVCGLHFEIEPGFFWGAMYVSYALTTAMMIILGALVFFIGHDPDFWIYIAVICGTVVLSSPLTYRYSRVLLLHLLAPVQFDKKYANL